MKNAIIIHGSADKEEFYSHDYPSLSNSHWLPWLQKQLLQNHILTQTPEMAAQVEPVYSQWKKTFKQFDINQDTTLIGFSCGAGFLVRWLSQNPVSIDKLVLVAPWLDPNRTETKNFFEFKIDPKLADRDNQIHILVSEEDDTEGLQESVKQLIDTIPHITVHTFQNHGHFTLGDMDTPEFPELLNIILEDHS